MRILLAFFVAVVSFISQNTHAALSEADFHKSTRCLAAGDLAEVMYSDLQKSQQLDTEPLNRWKAHFDKLGVPLTYLSFAHSRFFNARPPTALALAQDTAAHCVSDELPELKDNLPRSCYALSKSIGMFFQARKRGKTKEEILAYLASAEMKKRYNPVDMRRQIQAVHHAFSVPVEEENTAWGRTGYFALCLMTSGDIYGKPSYAQGTTYEEGYAAYARKDYKAAYSILKSLAEQGDARSQTQLGVLLLNQQSEYFDAEAGVAWLEKAARQNEVRAFRNLGIVYTTGSKDGTIAKNLEKSLEWSLRAAEAGDITSQRSIAQAYAFGFGVPKDAGKATYWFRKAAEQGDQSAQYNLGIAYFNGKGVKPDGKEAGIWFEKAALQGDKEAALQLFHLNSSGTLLPQDQARASCWLEVFNNRLPPTKCAGP